MRLFSQNRGSLRGKGRIQFSLNMHRIFSKLLCQAEGARVDQAGVGAVAGGGEAGEEGRGAGQDDPGKDAHRGVGEVTFSNMTLSIFNKWT